MAVCENPFRILLDFRELNFKFYKFVWMSISPRELVSIKDLKEALLKKFSFERTDLLLFLRDGLLPEDENISNILRENDSVRLLYAEPSNVNLNESKTINHEREEESFNDSQSKSPKKRKEHPDISESNDKQVESNKKRKHSFSNGTYLYKNTTENSALTTAVADDTENIVSTVELYNLEKGKRKSSTIKKTLKYSHDISHNSLVSENEISISSDIIPVTEKNQVKVNSCKKKKKHKHSKDVSENEITVHNESAGMSEVNGDVSEFPKKKKHSKDVSENEPGFQDKQSLDASQLTSVSKSLASFYNESISTAEKSNDFDTRNELSELRESIFQTVTDDSEILKVAPVNFYKSPRSSSSGIGHSLKASEESYLKISSEQNLSNSNITDGQSFLETEENNLSVSQGNNCKKRKRKRHRKRKSELISPEVNTSNNCELEISQRSENDSISTSASNKTTEFTPENNRTLNRPNARYSEKNTYLLTKDNFKKPFTSFLPSTSTPFSPIHAMSPKKNVISNMPGSSNAFQNCLVTTPLNAILPIVKKKMCENSPSTLSSPSSVSKNCNIATVLRNPHEESLPTKKNNSDKSNDSFFDKGVKNRLLDPSAFYKSCPPLNSFPLVGTHIAYKTLELDASYSPAVSNYKEGVVKAVNSQTDQLEIELIKPEVKEGRIGKFENIYDDELPVCEVINKVTLSWSSLIDPVRVTR